MENKRHSIMLVDDNTSNLLIGKTALAKDYTVMTVGSAEIMLKNLTTFKPDIILMDVDMPEMTGFEAIKILKENPETCDIPVVFVTAMRENSSELEGLRLGAVDYVTKPFSPPLLRLRVAMHLLFTERTKKLQERNRELEDAMEKKSRTIDRLYNKILTGMTAMAESRDCNANDRIVKTQRYLKSFLAAVADSGIWEKETADWDIEMLVRASRLHDAGRIAVGDGILKKNGPLSEDEREEMKRHVQYGVGFIEKLEDGGEDDLFWRRAKDFTAFHHEKWDGTGYPGGLAGEDIPLLGRILAIVDMYDGLTSARSGRKPRNRDEAVGIIVEKQGTHFDPRLVGLFAQAAETFGQAPQSEKNTRTSPGE
jgi:putative two-component system response regulator